MDFSESYRCSSDPSPCYSPDGRHVACVVEYRLLIREVNYMRIVQLYPCLDRVSDIQWSPDSCYVMCGLFSRGILQIWSVDQPEWTCKIDEGPAGVSSVQWTPDGLSVVVVADFRIRTTVWNLTDRKCTYLPGPKSAKGALKFSPGGGQLALLERRELRDQMTVYDCASWRQLCSWALGTTDAEGVEWSPDGGRLAVWDSCLSYKVLIVSASDGTLLSTYCAYEGGALGVKSVSWGGADGELLAVGSFDQVGRVLNHITWQPLMECLHPTTVRGPPHTVVYREVEESYEPHHQQQHSHGDAQDGSGSSGGASPGGQRTPGGSGSGSGKTNGHTPLPDGKSKFMVCQLPSNIPSSTSVLEKGVPQIGIGTLEWSPDATYLATVNEASAESVWLWDLSSMELASVLTTAQPIKAAKWAPQGNTLAIVTGSGKVYLWSGQGASVIHIPLASFHAHGLTWAADGSSFLLTDREAFCITYLTGP
ncbi:MAG: hypothetical protein WDW38_009141 [Sanguina aurantia]